MGKPTMYFIDDFSALTALTKKKDMLSSGALVFQLSQNLLFGRTVERVVLGIVRRVIGTWMLCYVLVHILCLDLKGKAVSVRVEELAALSVLRFELVVIEVVHQVLGEIQNAHAHIHRAIRHQVALVDLDSCQVVIEDIGPSKCCAGDEAPDFVLLMRTHQLHINPLPQVFHGLPEDRVVYQLVQVLFKVAGGLLPEPCIHTAPSQDFG